MARQAESRFEIADLENLQRGAAERRACIERIYLAAVIRLRLRRAE